MGACCDAPAKTMSLAARFNKQKQEMVTLHNMDKKWLQSFSGQVYMAICRLRFDPKSMVGIQQRLQSDILNDLVNDMQSHNDWVCQKLQKAQDGRAFPKLLEAARKGLAQTTPSNGIGAQVNT